MKGVKTVNIQELLKELERQKPLKWDQSLPVGSISMVMEGTSPQLSMEGGKSYQIASSCHAQIAERLEIPLKYYHRMREEEPSLLIENTNTWLRKFNRDVFVRGLGDSVRAFLSDRYRVIDHLDVLYCALNELQAHDSEIEDTYLSETEMNVKVKSNQLRDFVRHRDDRIMGGLLLTNSETGHKALKVEPRIFRVLCSNGMVMEEFLTRQIHLGNGHEDSDDTIYLSIRRSITELFGRFGEITQSLRESTEVKISNPQKVIHHVVEHYKLTEIQRDSILMAFGAEPDADQYGIANAITRAAQSEIVWENRIEMERLGGRLVTLPVHEFKQYDQN